MLSVSGSPSLRGIMLARFTMLIAACQDVAAPAGRNSVDLSYTDAYVMQPIGDRDMTAGGVTLSVTGDPVRLKGVSSPVFEVIEMHTMSMQDGRMQMRPVTEFELREDQDIRMTSGGDHLMMFGFVEPIETGETVELFADFATDDGPVRLRIEAVVRAYDHGRHSGH